MTLLRTIKVCAILAAFTAPSFAQEGDRKGHNMVDPIPAADIPPSPYLDLKDALKSFKVAPGFVIEPVASGLNVNMAVAVSFDANGRAWTVEMRSYMPGLDGIGEQTPNGCIRVLEDTNGDGTLDKATTFIEGLVLPRAVAVTSDGCLYTSGDTLYFTKRDGLKPVGTPIVVDKDYAKGGNPEHKSNGLVYGHDNWYYSAKSSKRYRRIKDEWVTQRTNFRGQWGIAKDNAGRLYYNTNSTLLQGDQFTPQFFRGNAAFTPKANMSSRLGSNRVHPIHMTPGVNRAYVKNTLDKEGKLINATATCGVHIYRGDNFPSSAQGVAFSCEPSADIIKAIKITRDEFNKPQGSHPYEDKEFLASTDEWFLPCNLYTAPDGTLWVVDMYFGLLQHKAFMSSYLRKQYDSRGLDKPKPSTGRIYRMRYAKNKASTVPKLEGLPASSLVEFLTHPNGLTRDTAQRLIVESADSSVVNALVKLASASSKPLGQIHALWTLDGLDCSTEKALIPALESANSDVINTALDIIATRRLSSPAIVSSIKALKDDTHTLHSRIRALAASRASEEALALVSNNLEIPLIREAFISGLGSRAKKFHLKQEKLADAKLEKILTSAAGTTSKKQKPDGSHLKAADLASFNRGKVVYSSKAYCGSCHGANGAGLANLGPPLARSEWVTGSTDRLTKILLHGMTGPIVVDGSTYKPALAMPGFAENKSVTDQDLADLMTYLRNSWGNKAKPANTQSVKYVREKTKGQAKPYSAKELAH